jgi:hypothetical protein
MIKHTIRSFLLYQHAFLIIEDQVKTHNITDDMIYYMNRKACVINGPKFLDSLSIKNL